VGRCVRQGQNPTTTGNRAVPAGGTDPDEGSRRPSTGRYPNLPVM
jgi:hypothetical protein